MKIIDKRVGGEYIDRFMQRELDIIVRLNHPNIISVYAIHQTFEYVAVVEEYAAKGDLLNYIRSKPDRYLDEEEARFFFRQLIEALIYLEHQYIVHRDIKCENIFLDANYNVKLGDFGFTRELHPDERSNTHCGSRPYAAIELLTGRAYTGNGVDIWSAGVVLYVMLTGCFPFGGGREDLNIVIRRQRLQSINFPMRLSRAVRDLIVHMLQPIEAMRATTRNILAHRWLENANYEMRYGNGNGNRNRNNGRGVGMY